MPRSILNQVFGRLTVMSVGRYVDCICSCGKMVRVASHNLRSGATSSCGCYAAEWRKITKNGLNAAINRVINKYKQQAKHRNLPWGLTDHEALFLMQDLCNYCGKEPQQTSKTQGTSILYNGIDRVDSSLGYTTANCVTCCKTCNIMKWESSLSDWFNQMRRVLAYYSHEGDNWEYCF